MPNYAHISSVHSDLLKKGSRFVWTKKADAAFLDLKSRLATQPVRRPLDYTLPFCLSVDTSDLAIGTTLLVCFSWLMDWNIPFASTARSWMPTRFDTPPLRKRHFPLSSLFTTLAYILALG